MSEARSQTYEQVLGVRFFCGSPAEAIDQLARTGGYMVVQASPALLNLRYDENFRQALQGADLVLADSGLLVAVWRVIAQGRLHKVSGIAYLRCLLERGKILTTGKTVWIVGSETARAKAVEWLREKGLEVQSDKFHVARQGGGAAEDHELLLKIEQEHPDHVVIALGAGDQEKFAFYLREYLLYRPNIHCVGAALGFLTGAEGRMPEWAEKARIGWLFRLIAQPSMVVPRIGIAIVLTGMLLRYRSELPPLKHRWSNV